jgi:hypothetical protein
MKLRRELTRQGPAILPDFVPSSPNCHAWELQFELRICNTLAVQSQVLGEDDTADAVRRTSRHKRFNEAIRPEIGPPSAGFSCFCPAASGRFMASNFLSTGLKFGSGPDCNFLDTALRGPCVRSLGIEVLAHCMS